MLQVRPFLFIVLGVAALVGSSISASQPPSPPASAAQGPAVAPTVPPALTFVPIRPIEPPARPLPSEAESANVKRFSFIAYGDTRSGGTGPGDGVIVHPIHSQIVDAMIAKSRELASTPFPLRFVIQSGDAVLRGANGAQWNVSFTPVIEKLTRGAGIPYFFSVGNHDVSGMPSGDPLRMMGLHNTLTAMSKLIPPEGSPRRLSGYPTYAFGYGNTFLIAFDSNLAADTLQLMWVTDQLERLDRNRFPNIVAFFHHPPFTSGPHGGPKVEPQTAAIRERYMPLFRKHHARLLVAGHDHLYDHWLERYAANGKAYRIDAIVTGGGGAPIYAYSGEPDLTEYLAAGAAEAVRVDHLVKPGPTPADNPHHFVIVQVDGERLSLEVVAIGPTPYTPYNGSARISLSNNES